MLAKMRSHLLKKQECGAQHASVLLVHIHTEGSALRAQRKALGSSCHRLTTALTCATWRWNAPSPTCTAGDLSFPDQE